MADPRADIAEDLSAESEARDREAGNPLESVDPSTREGGTNLEAKIIKTGRGPEIAGTRITVYDIIPYHEAGWHRDMIAVTLSLGSRQVDAALRYLDEHRDEVMTNYERNMERIRRGNPPELQAKLDAGHERFLAMGQERRAAREQEAGNAGRSGGH